MPPKNKAAAARIELGLMRFHRLLRFVELGAPQLVIDDAERLLEQSLAEIELSERDLARLYPRFRIVQMVRDAAENKRVFAEMQADDLAA